MDTKKKEEGEDKKNKHCMLLSRSCHNIKLLQLGTAKQCRLKCQTYHRLCGRVFLQVHRNTT